MQQTITRFDLGYLKRMLFPHPEELDKVAESMDCHELVDLHDIESLSDSQFVT